MDTETTYIILALLTPLIGGGVMLGYMFVSSTMHHLLFSMKGHNPLKYFSLVYHDLSSAEQEVLNRYAYYAGLPAQLKKIFRHRVRRFISSKEFEGMEGMIITDEVRVLIAASAVQLTFGLTFYKLSGIHTIVVHSSAYYSVHTGRFHLGEANPKGVIKFSWEDFVKGFEDRHDNRNLGIHEFAHALFISNLKHGEHDPRFIHYYDQWRQTGDREFFRMKKEKEGYLRSYAGTNAMEFFAVSAEYFFEAPNALKKNLPELYGMLVKMLGQDPARWIAA